MASQFQPLHDRVLLKRVEVEEKTPAGIIIPDTAKEKPVEGEVLAIGPGAVDDSGKVRPLQVKVGDRVLFGKWSGTEVIIEGEDRLIMKESDILGVIKGQCGASRLRPPDGFVIRPYRAASDRAPVLVVRRAESCPAKKWQGYLLFSAASPSSSTKLST